MKTTLELEAEIVRLPAFERRIRRYVRPDLLVLDELGYIPCDSRAADILYNIISRRHAERSTIISANLAFKQWGTVFPGAACVAALVDRFNQHCHKLLITADSWRETHQFDHDPRRLKSEAAAQEAVTSSTVRSRRKLVRRLRPSDSSPPRLVPRLRRLLAHEAARRSKANARAIA